MQLMKQKVIEYQTQLKEELVNQKVGQKKLIQDSTERQKYNKVMDKYKKHKGYNKV